MRGSTRIVLAAALAWLLTACGTSAPGGGSGDDGPDGGGPSGGDVVWQLVTPSAEEIDGRAWAFSDAGATITGTDSTPDGWTLRMSHDGPLEAGTAYASFEPTDEAGEGGLTVTITAPGGATCVVGPAETTVLNGDPQFGDTYAVAVYYGLSEDDGRPIVAFASVTADCDDLPGSESPIEGAPPVWQWGFGSL